MAPPSRCGNVPESVAVCPGTYDPVTSGHLDIITRAASIFDRVIVAVVRAPQHKKTMFTLDDRIAFIEESLGGTPNVSVEGFATLVVEFARQRGARSIVKGLRAVSDYEAEIQMAQMNHRLGGVETLFMPTNPKWSFLSSSLVKEVARFGGEVEGLVPDHVRKRLVDRIEAR